MDRQEILAHFPDVGLQTHSMQTMRYYTDLVWGGVVVVNMFFTSCGDVCPRSMGTLKVLRELLQGPYERVRMLSITLDPGTDTPDVLSKYAKDLGVSGNWWLLRASQPDTDRIRRGLGFTSKDRVRDANIMKHVGLVVIGNERGRWITTQILTRPQILAEKVRKVMERV